MPTEDFIIELFCRVDDHMFDVIKHAQASPLSERSCHLGLAVCSKEWQSSLLPLVEKQLASSCFPTCPIVHACFVCSTPIANGSTVSWLTPV